MAQDNHKSSSKPGTGTSTRRAFLKKLRLGIGVAASAEFLWVFFSVLSPGKKTPQNENMDLTTVGKLDEIPNNSVIPVRSGHFYLSRLADGGVLAVSLRCPHLGCTVSWDAARNRFVCPCHSSEFAMNGNVINPPAPRALDYFPVVIENGVVKVNTNHPVKRKKFEQSQETYG